MQSSRTVRPQQDDSNDEEWAFVAPYPSLLAGKREAAQYRDQAERLAASVQAA